MATTGKVPFLGFKAGAMKFLTLLGFSPSGAVVVVPGEIFAFNATIRQAHDFDVTVQRTLAWPEER